MSNENKQRLDWFKYTWEDFEDICFEYALNKYDTTVYRVDITERRKDKGRDIIISHLETKETAWAECKHRKRSIGLDDIGKNIVLAITNQINKIIFFSVSSITPNTKHEILRVAKIHGFDVLFLDGKNLDRELSGNKKLLNKYFKESFDLFHSNKKTLSVEVCVDEFKNAYNDTFYNNSNYCKLQNGLEFYVHVFIKNNYDQNILNLDLSISETENCHFYATEKRLNIVRANCDDMVTIKGVILNTQKVLELPHLDISYTVDNKPQIRKIELGEIDGTDCWYIPLCGDDAINFVAKIKEISNEVLKGYTRLIYIKGPSGSGKSRMLEEISSKMFQMGFQIINIDAMSYTQNIFYRELIRQLLFLPHLNSENMFSIEEFELLLKNNNIDFKKPSIIHNYLWYNKNVEPMLLGEFVFHCLIRKNKMPKLHIQIDNIQCLDKNIQQSLLYLCSVLSTCKSYICFAFALNTSLAKSTSNTSFIQYLENKSTHEEKSFLELYKIKELDQKSKAHIVKYCLKLSPEKYEKEIFEIANKAGALPLDVMLFCKNIYDSGCIANFNDENIIKDSGIFSQKLNFLSESMSSIIELRINSVCKAYSKKKKLNKLFQLLLFFENKLPIAVLGEFFIDMDMIFQLRKDLILSKRKDGFISFFHDNYYRLFLKYSNTETFTVRELKVLFKYCKKNSNDLNMSMKVNYVKCLYYLNMHKEFQSFSTILLQDLKNSYCFNEIISLANFYLQMVKSPKHNNERLLFSIEKALAEMEVTSFVKGVKALSKIDEKLRKETFNYNIELIGKFYHYYVNSYTHSGDYEEAIRILQIFEKINDIPLEYKFLIEDRYCLCYFSIGEFDKANKHIDLALKYAKKMSNNFWISTAYSDKAFNYFYNTSEKSKMRYYFNKAIKYYDSNTDQTPYRRIEIEIQTSLSYILCHNNKKAMKHIENAINLATERNYSYLLIPAQNVKAYILLLDGYVQKAITLLNQALFNSEIFGSNKWMAIIYNSLGIAYSLDDDFKRSFDCFVISEKHLREYISNKTFAERFTPIIVNLAISTLKFQPDLIHDKKSHYSFYCTDKILDIFKILSDGSIKKRVDMDIEKLFPLTINGFVMMY